MALSPDGHHVAFVGYTAGGSQLYLRALGEVEARPVPHTQGATNPFFSPDGQWLGSPPRDKLRKVAVRGGQPVTICDAPDVRGASWGDDGTILFVPTAFAGMSKVGADGGALEVVTKLDPKTASGASAGLRCSPAGRPLSSRRSGAFGTRGATWPGLAGDRGVKVLVKGASYPRYVDGILFYARGGSILASAFDVGRLAVTGPRSRSSKTSGCLRGSLAMRSSSCEQRGRGLRPRLPACRRTDPRVVRPHGPYATDRRDTSALPGAGTLSRRPSDRRLVSRGLATTTSGSATWRSDAWTRLTLEGDNRSPVWSPDGARVAFQSVREGARTCIGLRPTAAASPRRSRGSGPGMRCRALSLLTARSGGEAIVAGANGQDVWIVGTAEGSRPKPVVATPASELAGAFSPDGRWLAYGRTSRGGSKSTSSRIPGARGSGWSPATEGPPRWPRSGREIVYVNGNKMMACP